ncbi:thymidylate synthase [Candidatus Berkelbacteria bacterium]|nr:thymidylate synthase [Candidatus Berkelbacteria bacterium]
MKQYLDALRHVLDYGVAKGGPQKEDAITGVGVQMRFELDAGFPLITTRSLKGSWKALRAELLWILSGSTHLTDLHKDGVHFWDTWGEAKNTLPYGREVGDLGPIYGHQWRNFGASQEEPDGSFCADGATPKAGAYRKDGVDQITRLIDGLKRFPDYRRHRVVTWNPKDFNNDDGTERVFIAPCHGDFQIVHQNGELTMHHTQRSGDFPIGIPFNIGEYALLLMMIAQVTGFKAKALIHTISDAHIYNDQRWAVEELLTREPRPLPTVKLNPKIKNIFDFKIDDIMLENYDPHPQIKNISVQE